MRKLLVMLTVLGMAGCSSIADLRQDGAVKEFQSPKAPDSIAECLVDAWQSQKISGAAQGAHSQRLGDRLTVYTGDGARALEFADIIPNASGSHVSYYQANSLMKNSNMRHRLASLEPCL